MAVAEVKTHGPTQDRRPLPRLVSQQLDYKRMNSAASSLGPVRGTLARACALRQEFPGPRMGIGEPAYDDDL